MFQSNLKILFTRNNHRKFYSAISFDDSFIAAVKKIIVVIEKSKDLELVTTNAFEMTKTSHVVLIARDEIILIKAQVALKSVCICTQFSYWMSDITNAENMIKMFDFIRKHLNESSILILCASYFHTLKMRFDILEDELNRSFDLNFKIIVNLVRKFFDSMKKNTKIKIIINMSITTAHTHQLRMSTYEASKKAFITWLEHVQFENQNKLRMHNLHSSMNMLNDSELQTNMWNWKMRKSSFIIILMMIR